MSVSDADVLKRCAEIVADKARELYSRWSKTTVVRTGVRRGVAKVYAEGDAAYYASIPRNRAPNWGYWSRGGHYTGYRDDLSTSGELTVDQVAETYADEMTKRLLDESGL